MKIVIDKDIPFIQGLFEPYAEVVYLEGGAIGRKDIADADALIIRTRTECNRRLLAHTSVKIISTATIGTDHVDLDYCRRSGIHVTNASGCNSGAVMNYVLSALYGTAARRSISLEGKTMGIIGVGNVGRKVERAARALGLKVLLCDPPRAEAEGPQMFVDQETLLHESDIVTLHVPLNGETRRMAGSRFFSRMKPGAFFINAARGELVQEKDLIAALPKLGPVVIDTWNHEPHVNPKLLEAVDIATPHIAGYSYQGKQLGTSAAVRSVARFFGITELYDFYPHSDLPESNAVKLDFHGLTQGQIASVLQYNYPIFTDDFMFRTNPDGFEELRAKYRYRREFFID